MSKIKLCEGCEKVLIVRGDNEPLYNFKSRRTCSKSCDEKIAKHRQVQRAETKYGVGCLDPKECSQCGEMFSKRPGEAPKTYVFRQSCGKSCGGLLSSKIRKMNLLDALEIGTTSAISLAEYWEKWSETDKLRHKALTMPLINGDRNCRQTIEN